MNSNNTCPPPSGLASDPVLYGVARGLAQLFPLINPPRSGDEEGNPGREADGEQHHAAMRTFNFNREVLYQVNFS